MIFRSLCALAGLSVLLPVAAANTLVQTQYAPSFNLNPAGENSVELPLAEFFEMFAENPVATFTVRQPVLDEVRRVRIGERLSDGQAVDQFRNIQTYVTTDGKRYTDIQDVESADAFVYEDRTFTVRLLPESAPLSVANFITYTRQGDFDKSIIHRNITNFIMQGGSYRFSQPKDETSAPLWRVQSVGTVPMEADRPNAAGTLAMARPQQVDGATSSWFFNIANNTNIYAPTALGPYAVFGEIEGEGLQVIRDMNRASPFNIAAYWGGDWAEVPLTLPFNTALFTERLSSLVRFESVTVNSGSSAGITVSAPEIVRGTEEAPVTADDDSFIINFDAATGNLRVEAVDTGQIILELGASSGGQSRTFRTRFLSFNEEVTEYFPGILILTGSNYRSAWFGDVNGTFFPWLFHPKHHFLYASVEAPGYILFDARLHTWVHRSPAYPNTFYIFGLNKWVAYAADTGNDYDGASPQTDYRWFYLFDGDNSRWVFGEELRDLVAAAVAAGEE